MKKFTIRAARKGAHLSTKVLHKALRLTTKVEDKATRILNGTDFSVKADSTIPLEKIYYNSLPYITPINPALPAIGSTGSVVLLLPTLDSKSFYGGTATALVVAGRLAQLEKKTLKIVQTLKTGKPSNLSGFFEREGLKISEDDISVISVADRAYNVYGYLSMHPDDTFIASAWWDAYLISQLPLTKKFIYLIQDFEPIFYNNSDLYVLAESTYKTDKFVAVCNTKLMYDFMKAREYPAFANESATWFEPAVSRAKHGMITKKAKGERKRLFLYGRPDVHRNLFFMALNSIDYAFKAGFIKHDEWELFMAGQDNIPDIQLTSGARIQNLGKLSMEDYIAFSRTIDLAVSPMMAPHPNYPTLEFASIGSQVVTTRYSNKTDLSNYSTNIIMCDIDVQSMAGAIKLAASNLDNSRKEQDGKISDNWKTVLDTPISNILNKL